MSMASGLREGRFRERVNRFLARVEVDGEETLVHVPNSGRMRELFVPGATVYVSPGVTPGRKTAFDLRLVSIDGVLVSCDSRLPPSLVAEAQSLGRLAEFDGYPVIERERTFGESRLDLCFLGAEGPGVRGNEVGDVGLSRKSAVPGRSDYARDEARSDADEGSGRGARGGGGIRGAEGRCDLLIAEQGCGPGVHLGAGGGAVEGSRGIRLWVPGDDGGDKPRGQGAGGVSMKEATVGDTGTIVRQVYDLLYERYGPQGWWPAKTKLEVVLGAILVQSTAWGNAAKALDAIREAGVLDVAVLARLPEGEIAKLVRSSGFFTVKARRVKAFVEHVMEWHGGDLDAMLGQDASVLRKELLGIHGIGEETADCIVLYAAGEPTFVIDEYTRRIVGRLGVGPRGRGSYADYQRLFEEAMPSEAGVLGEFHALLIALGKDVCRRRPLCLGCALKQVCEYGNGK